MSDTTNQNNSLIPFLLILLVLLIVPVAFLSESDGWIPPLIDAIQEALPALNK